jgi:hypothetical protein
MFKGGGLGNMIKQAAQMQARLQKIQEEMQTKTAEGSAGGGAVVVVANGKQEIVSIKIDKGVLEANDIELLQDMIVEASNKALKEISKQVQDAIASVTGGMKIPGLF